MSDDGARAATVGDPGVLAQVGLGELHRVSQFALRHYRAVLGNPRLLDPGLDPLVLVDRLAAAIRIIDGALQLLRRSLPPCEKGALRTVPCPTCPREKVCRGGRAAGQPGGDPPPACLLRLRYAIAYVGDSAEDIAPTLDLADGSQTVSAVTRFVRARMINLEELPPALRIACERRLNKK